MIHTILPPEIRQLSIAERMLLADEIWSSIVDDEPAMELPQVHKELLDRRLTDLAANSDKLIPWEQVMQRIQNRLRTLRQCD